MSYSVLVAVLLACFSFLSMVYVYKYRGEVRYDSLREYLRKSWPIFAPLNCLLFLSTHKKARKPFLDLADFPDLSLVKEEWEVIRKEALSIMDDNIFEQTIKPGEDSSYDIGFRTFFKYGWSKFYCTWYGYTHASALQNCPKTVEIVNRIPSVNGAMFTLLPPGSQLTRHCDPIGCSLRYHIGLSTPNDDDCYINIDGSSYSWRDGDAILFDETYLHFARNDTDTPRLILMLDVERPMGLFGRGFNLVYKRLVAMTVVPNAPGDKRGFFNKLFSTITPIMNWGQKLKKRNRKLYKTLEYTLNAILASILLLVLASPFVAFG